MYENARSDSNLAIVGFDQQPLQLLRRLLGTLSCYHARV